MYTRKTFHHCSQRIVLNYIEFVYTPTLIRGSNDIISVYSCFIEAFSKICTFIKGDQVVEWNGRSLVEVTFEEAQAIISASGDIVQLSVIHTFHNE